MKRYLLPLLLIAFALDGCPRHSAYALTAKPPNPATQPVPASEYDPATGELKVVQEYTKFNKCAFAKPGYSAARSANTFTEVEQAYWFAVGAAAKTNNAEFQKNAATIRSEIVRLSPMWGC